jgi:hypothetical protein
MIDSSARMASLRAAIYLLKTKWLYFFILLQIYLHC